MNLTCLCTLFANQSHHYNEPDNRDWHGRSGQSTSFGGEKSWDTIREHKESSMLNSGHQEIKQLNKQAPQHSSSNQVSLTPVVLLMHLSEMLFFSCVSSHSLCLFFSLTCIWLVLCYHVSYVHIYQFPPGAWCSMEDIFLDWWKFSKCLFNYSFFL